MNALLNQKAAAIASLATELKPLAEKSKAGELTADESSRFDDLTGQLNAAMEDFKSTEARIGAADTALGAFETFTKAQGPQERQPVESPQPQQAKSLGQQFIESDEFTEYRKRPQGESSKFKADRILNPSPAEMKTLIYSGTPSASLLLPQVLPTIYRGVEQMSAVRQVLSSGRTSSDNVTVLRENVFTNAAVEVAEATALNEGAKPESAISFTEETFPVRTIAHWIPVTRQTLEDLPMMQTYIDGRLRDGLERRIDAQLINGNGTAPNISGILDQSTITVADAAYFAGAPVNDAGSDNENINRIRRAKRLVRTTGLANPTFILANPADVEDWDTLTTTDGQYLLDGPQTNGNVNRLWGLPVYEDEYVTAGTAIVGDGSMAAVIDRTDAAVYVADQHDDYFIRNIFVLLAEVRLTLAVFRPAAFVVVTLA